MTKRHQLQACQKRVGVIDYRLGHSGTLSFSAMSCKRYYSSQKLIGRYLGIRGTYISVFSHFGSDSVFLLLRPML